MIIAELTTVFPREIDLLQRALGYDVLFRPMKKQRPITEMEFHVYAFQIEVLYMCWEIKSILVTWNPQDASLLEWKDLLQLDTAKLVEVSMKIRNDLSNQFRHEVLCETRRILFQASIFFHLEVI